MGARSSHRFTVLAAVAVASAVGLSGAIVLVAASPADAAAGLTSVSATSAVDSSMTKTVTAACPAGTTVVGGGGHVSVASGQHFLTGLRPVVSIFGAGYQATATEDDTGYSGNWYVVAYALCAPAPAGLTYRWVVSPTSSQPARSATATCPAGKKVIGTGAVVNNGGRHVGLRYLLPSPDLTQLVALAHEDEDGTTASWSLTSWAVCADPLRGLERVVGFPSAFPISATAACPSSKRVYGAGSVINGGESEVVLVGTHPALITDSAIAVGAEDETGYGGRWTPIAVAICAY